MEIITTEAFQRFKKVTEIPIPELKEIVNSLKDKPGEYFTYRIAKLQLFKQLYNQMRVESGHPDELQISSIGIERCNRGCEHCGLMAKPSLGRFGFEQLKKWISGRGADEITFSTGEPFFEPDLPRILKMVLETNPNSIVRLITSGINFGIERERRIAEEIAAMPEEMKERIFASLSVSSFPHFGSKPASQAQAETLAFFLENDVWVELLNYLDANGEKMEKLVVTPARKILADDGVRPRLKIGKLLRPNREVILTAELADATGTGTTRTLDSYAFGYKKGIYPSEFFSNPYLRCLIGTPNIEIRPDGSVGLGCCHFTASFMNIADIDGSDLKEKIEIFRMEVKKRCGKTREGPCTACIGAAVEKGWIRRPDGLRNLLPGISKNIGLPAIKA